MVNEKIKNPTGPSSDSSRRSPSVESIPHRPRKRSLSTMLATKGGGNQSLVREEAEATRLLARTAPPSKATTSPRQTESARLLKLIPDLNQKEVSRLVAALIKKQKRDSRSSVKTRDRATTRAVPPLFPEKQTAQKLSSREVQSQTPSLPMPARAAAVSRHDALRMLKETESHPEISGNFAQHPALPTERQNDQRDLAEELIHRTSPR